MKSLNTKIRAAIWMNVRNSVTKIGDHLNGLPRPMIVLSIRSRILEQLRIILKLKCGITYTLKCKMRSRNKMFDNILRAIILFCIIVVPILLAGVILLFVN